MERALSISFLALAACLQIAGAYEVVDVRGNSFSFDAPPKCATIVPSVTQTVCAIGAENLMLANSRYCDSPKGADSLVKIGGYIDPDYEKIAEIKPPLFILPDVKDARLPDRLKALGVPCFFIHSEGLGNISANMRLLGKLFCVEEAAERAADKFDAAINGARARKGSGKRIPKALFMFGKMAAGKGSYVGDMIAAAGAENAADCARGIWPVLSREFILSCDPDVLFVELGGESSAEELLEFYRGDPVWRNVSAVKKSRVCFVPRRLVGVPGPKVAEAVALMGEYIKSQGLK